MIIFKKAADLAKTLDNHRKAGRSIGFVPTMGALHAGHISLIDISKKNTDITVCSIFVNPTQFNDPKDFEKYPVTIGEDIRLLEAAGTDILFLPGVAEMYPDGVKQLENYDLGKLESLLEGAFRPGHFQGVCQVMSRLLAAVRPDDLYMGQKDYQQCMVVSRLLEIIRLPTRLHPSPIIREQDGLAMSSRNMRLTPEQRQQAVAIFEALTQLKAGASKERAAAYLSDRGFRVDYVSIADPKTLEPVADDIRPAVALVAAFLGEIRLIDNMVLN